MGKYSGILICSDYDGTLALEGKVLPGNAEALEHFAAEGGRFTVISGRTVREIRRMTEGLPVNAPIGAINGTLISDCVTGETLYAGIMDPGVSDLVRTLWHRFDYIRSFSCFDCNRSYLYKRAQADELPLDDFLAALPADLHKCCIHTGPEHSAAFRDLLRAEIGDRFNISRSWNGGIEMQSIRDSKGEAVRRMRALLGDAVHTIVCVGDYENDIPMFEAADRSYAVGDGSPDTLAAAERITVPVRENAVAAVIRDL